MLEWKLLFMIIIWGHLADGGSETWKWEYNETVCFNQGENATLTWRVHLNSGESVANVEIWQIITAGGAASKMFIKTTGPDPGFNDRIMSATVLTVTNSPPVFDVVFTLANLSNSIDGYGTKKIQCRLLAAPSFITGQPAEDTLLKVQVPIHNFIGPSSTTVSELDSVNLTCSADGSPTPTFRWTNPKGEVVGQGSSYIPAVYRNMSGEYTCIATDGCGGNYSRSATVTVQYKPGNTKLSSSNTRICQNDSVTLTCSVTADPPVSSYTFYNNGNILTVSQSSGTYVLKATIPDVNTITCEPSNAAGRGANDTIQINVNVPISTFTIDPTRVTVNESDSLNMTCTADGTPPPNITWTNPQEQTVTHGSTYRLTNIHRKMAGNYTCTAVDGCSGTYNKTATLTVQYKPENTRLSSSNTSVCQNDSVTLTCSVRADPPVSSYTFYNNGNILVSQSSAAYVLKATIPGFNNITCDSSNAAGRGTKSSTAVTVNVPISKITIDPTSVTVNESDSVTLTCTADGTPPPNIIWTNPQGQTVGHGPTYRLTNIHRNVVGVYTCTAVDGCGGTYNKTVTLTVHYKPENTKLYSSNASVCQNESVTLMCSATADPPVSSYTFYDSNGNTIVSQSSGTYVLQATSRGVSTIRCEPFNVAGRGRMSSTVVTVNVPIRKIIVDPSSVTVNESDSATLTCTADGTPEPNIKWTNPQGQTVGHGPTYSLTNINKNMAGVYTCTAVDGCGVRYSKTAILTVQYISFKGKDKYSDSSTTNLTVESNPPARVTCRSSQQPLRVTAIHTYNWVIVYDVALPQTDSPATAINCQATNSAGMRKGFTFVVYKLVAEYPFYAQLQLAMQWDDNLADAGSPRYKMLRNEIQLMLENVYMEVTFVRKAEVISFGRGSVVVFFRLNLIARVPDPLQLLKDAIKNGQYSTLGVDPTTITLAKEPTLPEITDVVSQTDSIKVSWRNENSPQEAHCYVQIREFKSSGEWKVSSGRSNSSSLECAMDDLLPDTLYVVKLSVSRLWKMRNETVYIRTRSAGTPTGTANTSDNSSLIAGLGALVAILLALNIVFVAYIIWLRRKDIRKTERSQNDNRNARTGFENMAMEETHSSPANTSQRATTADVVYEPVGDASQHPTSDTIPQYEPVSNLLSPGIPSRDPVSANNRATIPEYEDVSRIDGRNVTIATNNTGLRTGAQVNTSTQNPSYVNTRQRSPESQIYQPLQTADSSREDAQYGSLNSATRYGAESGLSSAGSEAAHNNYENTGTSGGAGVYQRLGRRTVDPVYQSTGNTTSA